MATTTTASTAAKAVGEAGGKVASMSQNIGNNTPDIANNSAPSAKADKLNALSGAKTNPSLPDASAGQTKTSSPASIDTSALNGSNGITGNPNSRSTTQKPTSTKFTEAGKHLGKMAEQAGRMSGSGHSGGAELNINPHKE